MFVSKGVVQIKMYLLYLPYFFVVQGNNIGIIFRLAFFLICIISYLL